MSDWREVRISELSTIDIGGTPSRAISAFWVEKPVGHPWISIADLKGKYVFETKEHITALGVRSSNVKLIPANTTVMSFKLTVGRTAITGREMFCNEAIAIFQPKDERLNGQWLYHALPKAATSVVTDTAVKGATLNKAKMAEMTLNLPPLVEQIKIAEILDTLDTAIHETEAIIAKLKAVKQGLLHDLLTRGIAANGELRPPQAEAPHLYQQSPLGWIPKEWEVSTVGEQFEIQLGKMLDGQKNAGILKPYLGNKAVQWDRIDLGEVQQVRLSKSDLIRFRLQKGDLLVCEGGDVGRAAIWENDLDECYYQKALHRLRPLCSYHPRLMLEIFRYLMGRDALSEYVSRTSIAHLTQEKLAAVPLPTPKIDEQERMVAEILTAKQRLETEESQLQKLRLLKSALMDDLLTGRVRVTPLLEAAAP